MDYPIDRRFSTPRLQRNLFDFAALLLILALFAALLAAAGWQFWHANRIYTGVTVGGVPVGGLTRSEALHRLNTDLYMFPLPPVTLTYQDGSWPLPIGQVRAQADLVNAVNRAYLVGRQGAPLADLGSQIGAVLRGIAIQPPLVIDRDAVRAALLTVAQRIAKPGVPARQIGNVAVAPEPGLSVDVDTTLQRVMDALQTANLQEAATVPLAATPLLPTAQARTTAGAAAGTAPPAGSPLAVTRPLRLRAPDRAIELALDPALLSRFVTPGQPPQIDEAGLRAWLADLAPQFDVPARDARLRFNPATGGVTVLQASQPGSKLDIDATVAAVGQALASGAVEAQLGLVAVPPTVDSDKVAEMGIRELVASASTQFAGSSASRVRNIEVAAAKFDGAVVPPNGIFSFNDLVRDVSSANGFEDSLIIWGDRTAVGVGGGVCQVSTTLFRTAYEGGFPIVERHNHGYVVDWYGEPGLDATIFTPSVDFKFRNDTGAYLLIEPVVDKDNGIMTFNFYGTRPDRTVSLSKPEYTDLKQPEVPMYQVDDSLQLGQKKQVEWEKMGMTAVVTRTIVENGTTRTDTVTSQYQPWRAVYLVGPGTEIPATPTPNAPAGAASEASSGLLPAPTPAKP